MTDNKTINYTVSDLDSLLEIYGADQNRWPDDQRDAACDLLERDGYAREKFSHAVALDRVLDQAPVYGTARSRDKVSALSERIAAAAMGDAATSHKVLAPVSRQPVSVAGEAGRDGAQDNVIYWSGQNTPPRDAGSNVKISLPSGDDSTLPLAKSSSSEWQKSGWQNASWRSPALLAASLLLGLYIGFSNSTSPVAQSFAEATGVVGASDAGLAALDIDDTDFLDEEAL